MRDVKFRGLNKEGKWVYGNLFTAIYKGGWVYAIQEEVDDESIPIHDSLPIHIIFDFKTIGQYTGLKDKNGKEIYEGDVIKRGRYTNYENNYNVDEMYGVIEQKDYSWCVIQRDNDKCFTTPLFMEMEFGDIDRMQVVGNIYENPELIK
ncbi:YopX family protein [Terrisporobacter sp.]|uniref:YopX family protein n=1 Tax=Terrisporobacter sp. TaxID=1965305 RepID=UPI00289FC7FC|nr:YopX family protein [Terrisporobacter sp.]